MIRKKIIFLTFFILMFNSLLKADVYWTTAISPIPIGVFKDIMVTDFNNDGVADLLAAGPGITVWLGRIYFQDGKWKWALSNPYFASGMNATLPIAGKDNVGKGATMTIPRTSNNLYIENWVIACSAPTEMIELKFYDESGVYDVDKENFFVEYRISERHCRHNEEWTLTAVLYEGQCCWWEPTSNVSGKHPPIPPAQWAVTDGGELGVHIYPRNLPPSTSITPGDKLKFKVKMAEFVSTADYHIASMVMPDNSPLRIGPQLINAKYGSIYNFMSFYILPGDVNVEVGDYFTFKTPLGPDTEEDFSAVYSVDINHDGLKDIIAGNENGLYVCFQKGVQSTSPSLIVKNDTGDPIRIRNKKPMLKPGIWNLSGNPSLIAPPGHPTTTTLEYYFMNYTKDTDNKIYWSVFGDVAGNFYSLNEELPNDDDPLYYVTADGRCAFTAYELPPEDINPSSSFNDDPFQDFMIDASQVLRTRPNYVNKFNRGTQIIFSSTDVTFGTLTKIDTCPVNSIIAEDFNNDSSPDIAICTEGKGIRIYQGYYYGSFAYVQSIASNATFNSIAVADFDHDGDVDIAATSNNGVKVYRGASGVFFSTKNLGPNTTDAFYGITLGDFNHDGKTDIAATKAGGGIEVWYLINTSPDSFTWYQNVSASTPIKKAGSTGNGSMSAITVNPLTANIEEWQITCIEERPDSGVFRVIGSVSGSHPNAIVGEIYTSKNNEVKFLITDGSIDWKIGDEFKFITARGPLTIGFFHDIDCADLDNDGNLDLFASGENIGIHLWLGNGVFGWIEETSPKAESTFLCLDASTDINRDGNPDIISGANGGGIQAWMGDGVDKFPFSNWISVAVGSGGFFGVDAKDLNNDGNNDIIAAHFDPGAPGVQLWYGNGNGQFVQQSPVTSLTEFYSVICGDYNNDGLLDVIAGHKRNGVYVFKNLGDGGFAPPIQVISTGSFWGLDVADVNNDGKLDILGAEDVSGLHLWLGDGRGNWTEHNNPTFRNIRAWGVKACDYNLDGLMDIFVSGHTGQGVWQWFNLTNSPAFYYPIEITWDTRLNNIYGLLLNDINRNGIPDLIAAQGGNYIYCERGTGASPHQYAAVARYYWVNNSDLLGTQSRGMSSGDIDNDGIPDFVVAVNGNGVRAIKAGITTSGGYDESISWSAFSSPVVYGDYHGVKLADFTNDGLLDIVAAHAVSGGTGLEVWISNRDFTPPYVSFTSPRNRDNFRIGVDKEIIIRFSEAIDRSTLNSLTFRAKQQNTVLTSAYFLQRSDTEIKVVLDENLIPASDFNIVITGGFNGVSDLAGNGLDGNNNGIVELSPVDDFILTLRAVDITPPDMPRGFNVVETGECYITLAWLPNAEKDLTKYELWQTTVDNPKPSDWKLVSEIAVPDPQHQITTITLENLICGQKYYYVLSAVDKYGNVSAPSNRIQQTVPAIPPAKPTGFRVLGYDYRQVTFGWDKNTESDLNKYEIWGTIGKYPSTPNWRQYADLQVTANYHPTSYTITHLENDINYTFIIAAVDKHRNVSEPSDPLVVVPGPVSPEVLLAGYLGTRWYSHQTSTLTIAAYVVDPQGLENIEKTEIYLNGQPTGVLLYDDGTNGDIIAGDSVFMLTIANIPPGAPAGRYLLEIRAKDKDGHYGLIWPYYHIINTGPPETYYQYCQYVEPLIITPFETLIQRTINFNSKQEDQAPSILAGGYLGSRTYTSLGGNLVLVVFVIPPQYRQISQVRAYLYGAPRTNYISLKDDGRSGDYSAHDDIWGIYVPIPPLPMETAGAYLLEVEAQTNYGVWSETWPYLTILP